MQQLCIPPPISPSSHVLGLPLLLHTCGRILALLKRPLAGCGLWQPHAFSHAGSTLHADLCANLVREIAASQVETEGEGGVVWQEQVYHASCNILQQYVKFRCLIKLSAPLSAPRLPPSLPSVTAWPIFPTRFFVAHCSLQLCHALSTCLAFICPSTFPHTHTHTRTHTRLT